MQWPISYLHSRPAWITSERQADYARRKSLVHELELILLSGYTEESKVRADRAETGLVELLLSFEDERERAEKQKQKDLLEASNKVWTWIEEVAWYWCDDPIPCSEHGPDMIDAHIDEDIAEAIRTATKLTRELQG